MMKTKAPKRGKSEGARGPRKGSGGRPAKTTDRRHRSILLCDKREWPLLFHFSNGMSYTDRVRACLSMTSGTRGARAKITTRWKQIVGGSLHRAELSDPKERSIYLGKKEWSQLAKLFPVGSWADKMRQLLELARIVKALSKNN